jgi:predicted phosphodiesterase
VRDVTFLAVSDTHVGYVPEEVHAVLARKIDTIGGRAYPASLGGAVGAPHGLLVAGDLTEWGREDEFARFLSFYGNRGDGGVHVPVLEVVGNHDKVSGPLPLAGPWSTGHWFGDGDFRARLAALLEGRCVAAIFHGHHHASAHYLWRGIHVYKPGAVKDGAHTFAVAHVGPDTMTVAYFDYDRDAWAFAHTRKVCVPSSTSVD